MEGGTEFFCYCVSVGVVSVCMIMKLPQIYNVIKAKSSQGISLQSLMMEFWCFTILCAYPMAHGYPLSGYLEMILLAAQDLILLLIVWKDRNMLSYFRVAVLVLYLSFIYSLAMDKLSPFTLYAVSTSVTPFAMGGKILQAASIVSARDAGSVSPLTWGLGTCTASARLLTGYFTTGDRYLMFLSAQAALLNALVCITALCYGRSRTKAE